MLNTPPRRLCSVLLVVALLGVGPTAAGPAGPTRIQGTAREILARAEFTGGLILHVDCGTGELTAALGASPGTSVHGVDRDRANVDAARRHIAGLGRYGEVAVDRWDGARLPYADGIANLVVLEHASPSLRQEALRVTAPLGVVLVRTGNGLETQRKPWPEDIDEWGHYLHDADNNAVAHDQRVGPPRSLQWVGSPRWARHHDRLPSMSALVSAGGRLFYILDQGATASILLPATWSLVARDAFSGVVLWKNPIPQWQTRLWPLKSGPAQLPRRLVATRDTVYATLGIDVPVTAVDAKTGRTLRTYEGTKSTEELLVSNGLLLALVDPAPDLEKYSDPRQVSKPWWTGKTVKIAAMQAASGSPLWQHDSVVVPLTLAANGSRVCFHDGQRVVCLDQATGKVRWQSPPLPLVKRVMSFFAPTLVMQDEVVLFAGGEESGLVKSSGGATESDTLTALDGTTGKVLWSASHPPSGYSSPEDVFVTGGLVWSGGVSNGNMPGAFTGLDLRTGEARHTFQAADVETYWFHHRCHRAKATDKYLMVSRTGIEFIDPTNGHWDINHWVRGGCLYGIMPANGLVYTPPHACACYAESKLFGLNALAAAAEGSMKGEGRVRGEGRLEKGPAYGTLDTRDPTPDTPPQAAWPTFRHDAQRSGATTMAVRPSVAPAWKTEIGGKLSAVTVAHGRTFVAAVDAHTVHAVDSTSGTPAWAFTAGGRVDSPPTVYKGLAIFGSADGCIYCLRAADGRLVWRFRAAPRDERVMAFEQLESRWPVHGSVLVQDGVVHAVAGRSLFLDGGMRLCRLDAGTGRLLSEEALDDKDPETGSNVQIHVKRLTMPVALPDVLSSDGRHLYMRSQVFDMNGKRLELAPVSNKLGAHASVQEGETKHLFASAGFLDDTWFHRAYWVYGRKFEGGWNSYYLAGRKTPAGKILAVDGERVYGFGREPKYFRWTTPMEFHLFAATKTAVTPPARKPEPDGGSVIRVAKSKSLNPANTPLTVMAWANPEQPNGVVVARGGGIHGYSLYIRKGKPHFAVTGKGKRSSVAGAEALPKGWVHLTGVLDTDKQLRVLVNGIPVATAPAHGLVPEDPADSMQVGADEASAVGDYRNALPFKGVIDEVRVYHRALSEDEIRPHAGAGSVAAKDDSTLVLHYTFDKGTAADASGNKNTGTVVGAVPVAGKLGRAMLFSGRTPKEQSGKERFIWSTGVPILVRGMVAAGKVLFVAGPEDVLDEPAALKELDKPETRKRILDQHAALAGKSGGVLRAVAAADGRTLAELRLETTPVWDGLAAANGRLYLSATDGTLRCYAGE